MANTEGSSVEQTVGVTGVRKGEQNTNAMFKAIYQRGWPYTCEVHNKSRIRVPEWLPFLCLKVELR